MRLVAGRNRQPGRSFTEARIRSVVPLHGGALAVTSLFLRPPCFSNGILDVFLALRIVICHPNLFAVIHDWRAAQGQIQSSHYLRNGVVVNSVAITDVCALDVMV